MKGRDTQHDEPIDLRRWRIAGRIAAVAIVLSIPLHVARVRWLGEHAPPGPRKPRARFVGSEACKDCHRRPYDLWKGSHHDLAMAVATPDTVLGDFADARLEHDGFVSRFYREGDGFFVHTQGVGGRPADFRITHTFGCYPLQQYLVPFPGGRLQCLPLAWDVREHRWFHLSPGQAADPTDWLYWTNAGQNWNGMCAECHSTNLRKRYDLRTDTFDTTWTDIDVGCEACHGPGSRHVAWAEMPAMARPPAENHELVVKTSGLTSRRQVELCAPCHSRRAALGDYTHAEPNLLDSLLPTLLEEGLYFPDGQILQEVYVYGSFTQSKMYHRDVRCGDCHDVHGLKTVQEGNALCLQCHRAAEYDTPSHHFHKQKGEQGEPIRSAEGKVLFAVGSGAECVQCHMPGRFYMVIDYRPDHSLRVPDPGLSLRIDTPNACNRCHVDKDARWADETLTKWYGPGRRAHYGEIIAAGRRGQPEAREGLTRLAGDTLYPVIVRATALSLLGAYPGEDSRKAFAAALLDGEALLRRAAAEHLNLPDPPQAARLLAPLLYDPVKAVRIEAARRLVGEPAGYLRTAQRKALAAAVEEFQAAMEYSADFAFGRYNLANLFVARNEPERAVEQFRAAIRIDGLFYPAQVNLAMLYNRMGKNDQAEQLFRDVLAAHPDLHDIAYSLGLLLAEENRHREAAEYLRSAAEGMPGRARVHYNLGLLLQAMGRDGEAREALEQALRIEPDNLDFLYALVDFHLKHGNRSEARRLAERMVEVDPSNPAARELLRSVQRTP